jgi:small-conductance mechanosensitive channel/CRP-like cAMP-binding protein
MDLTGASTVTQGLLGLGATALAYAVFTSLQRYLSRYRLLKAVALQLNLLALAMFAMLFMAPVLAQWHRYVLAALGAGALFLIVAISLRALDGFVFEVMARWRRQAPVPIVVRDIARWAVALIALVFIVRGFFPGVNLNVLAVSSIVVGYILGNATQDTLGNLIAGLALNTERPFEIGDWVTVGGHTGRIVDTTWRATRLRTKTEDYIVIPNASIAREPIVNFSRPTRSHGCTVSIGVDYETPPNKARHTILQVLHAIPDVCAQPPPSVWLTGYADFSINFTVKFFIDDFAELDRIQSTVLDRLWYAFQREGINIPFPIQDVRLHDATASRQEQRAQQLRDIRQALSQVDLFQSLAEDEAARLAAQTQVRNYGQGEVLVREGDAGDTFYIISRGTAVVTVAGANGQSTVVARLGQGAFFGEMSLLTGERRAATVTAETDVGVMAVSRAVLAGILQADAALASKLAAVLEKRTADNKDKLTAGPSAETTPVTHSTILARIRRFFGLP